MRIERDTRADGLPVKVSANGRLSVSPGALIRHLVRQPSFAKLAQVRAARLLGLYFAVLLACGACASQPTRSAEQRYLHALEDANRVYETALREAGRSHAEGVLTDEQLAAVARAGVAAERSLRAAKASFEAWLTLNGADGGELDRAMAALQVALAALLEAQHGDG